MNTTNDNAGVTAPALLTSAAMEMKERLNDGYRTNFAR